MVKPYYYSKYIQGYLCILCYYHVLIAVSKVIAIMIYTAIKCVKHASLFRYIVIKNKKIFLKVSVSSILVHQVSDSQNEIKIKCDYEDLHKQHAVSNHYG